MAQLLYANQFKTTTLSVVGGIDDSQTTSIVIQSTSGIDTTKPGVACLTYTDPIDVDNAEWIEYTAINSTTKTFTGVTRGSQGYSAKSHDNGVTVAFPISEDHINRINEKLNGNDTIDNDLDFDANTRNITVAGADPYRTITLTAGFLAPTTTSGCATVATDEFTTNDIDYSYLAFDSSSTESAFAVVQMPDSWDAGAIQYRYSWWSDTGTTSDTVVMSLSGRSYADGDSVDQAPGTAVTLSDTNVSPKTIRTSSWSGDVTLAGTPAAGEVVYLKLSKTGGTMAEDAKLSQLQIRYKQANYGD